MADDPTATDSDPQKPPDAEEAVRGAEKPTSSPNEEAVGSGSASDEDKKSHASSDTASDTDGTATPKKRMLKIGSQRNEQGKIVTLAKASKPDIPQNDSPTIDSVVTPELQKEIDLAIGDTEIDQLLTSPVAVASEFLAEGERVEGRILSVSDESIVVDLNRPHQGILTAKQFEVPPAIGDTVSVLVRSFSSQDGIYELAIPGATMDVEDWSELSENMTVEVLVTGHNKGGLEVSTSGLKGFIPASQVALFRVNDLQEFVGKKFSCIVTKVEAKRRNLILSRRAILEREREANREKMLATLQKGQLCKGIVSKIQPFGAFVDLGGIDGLIHISKMSWTRINHPSEILKEGEAIEVKIERIDQETGKIGLSYRDTFENPWHSAGTRYPARSRCKGTVTRITEFGAFVRLEAGIEGLLHVSEIAHRHVQRVGDILSKDEEIEVQVLSVDTEAQRISLSLKALEAPPAAQAPASGSGDRTSPASPKNAAKSNLKGGTDRKSGGEQFGLKW